MFQILASTFFIGVGFSAPPDDLQELAKLFADNTPELQFEVETSQFVGVLHRLEDHQVLWEMIRRSDGKISCYAQLDPQLIQQFKVKLAERFPKYRFKEIETSGCELKLLGPPNQSIQKAFPGVKIEKLKIPSKDSISKPQSNTIFLELAFVEIKKAFLQKVGFRFGDPIQFSTEIVNSPKTAFLHPTGFNPIASFLDFATAKNYARVHLKQSMIALEGEEAKFLVGGEYSFKSNTAYSSHIAKINYGIELDFLGKVLRNKNIQIKLKAIIREPDLSSDVGDYPEIREKNLSTRVVTQSGASVSVAGLFRSHDGRSTEAVPGFEKIPLLGRLFQSKDFRDQKSEAYLFITPKILHTEDLRGKIINE